MGSADRFAAISHVVPIDDVHILEYAAPQRCAAQSDTVVGDLEGTRAGILMPTTPRAAAPT